MRLAVLGGGPVGLEMAVASVRRGMSVSLFERGATLASNVLSWGHVTLFSPNSMNCSKQGLEVLTELGVEQPSPEEFPTGLQYFNQYLSHLGSWLSASPHCQVRTNCRVVSAGREGKSKGEFSREGKSFRLLVEATDGAEEWLKDFQAVVDCTGTYGQGRWLGEGGVPALGERRLAEKVEHRIPDVLGDEKPSYDGKLTMVVGAGASAATVLQSLKALGTTKVIWVTRREGEPYTVQEGDPLPQREKLYKLGNSLAARGESKQGFSSFRHIGGSGVVALQNKGDKVLVSVDSMGKNEVFEVDNILAMVGYRPDTSITKELQVHYCYATEGPMKLAAALMAAGGGGGDCLAQVVPGPATLLTPEPGLLVLGMKSYGRGSAFLLRLICE